MNHCKVLPQRKASGHHKEMIGRGVVVRASFEDNCSHAAILETKDMIEEYILEQVTSKVSTTGDRILRQKLHRELPATFIERIIRASA